MRPGQNREGVRAALRSMLLKATGAREFLPPDQQLDRPPLGCEMWAKYLLELETMRQYAELEITAEEYDGLLLIQEERRRFERDFIACPECGTWTTRMLKKCPAGHVLRN